MVRRSTTQDVSWFIDINRNGQLNLDPPYQRRSVWTNKDRKFFLDTIFRGYPSPSIFLHKSVEGDKTQYDVVDGKQRLQTVFMFIENKVALPSDFGDERFNGKTWKQLHQTERQILWDYVFPVEFLTFDDKDSNAVNLAFDRLNRNMRKLEPQELRHARWDGWFMSQVETESEDPRWRRLGVVTNARMRRMKEAQFISELILVVIEKKLSGFDQQLLDNAYAQFDDLDEADTKINPDEILEQINAAKEFLVTVDEANGSVMKYASTLGTFYTLWSTVVLNLHQLPTPKVFAEKFATFMDRVVELDSPESKGKMTLAEYAKPLDFLEASRGASTDLAPRQRRFEALTSFLLRQ